MQAIGLLALRQRLARQGGLVNFKPRRKHQPAISGHRVAGLQQHHIARNQVFGRDFNFLPIPAYPRFYRQHAFKRRQTLFRPVFLVKPDGCIDQDNRHNDQRIFGIANKRGKACGADQNQNQNAFKLAGKYQPR